MKVKVIQIYGFVLLVSTLVFMLMFFKYVSIGSKIAQENYGNNYSEWFWNIGLFFAIMAGFNHFIGIFLDWTFTSNTQKSNKPTKEKDSKSRT